MQKNGSPSVQCIFRETVLDRIRVWETKVLRRPFRMKKEDETMNGVLYKRGENGKDHLEKMMLPLLSEIIAEIMWRAMGRTCGNKKNAVLKTLGHVFTWRSTV